MRYSEQFVKKQVFGAPFPPPHQYKGQPLPPDGQQVLLEEAMLLGDDLPIGLSYPTGMSFGPYTQYCGEGLHPQQVRLDLSCAIPFSAGNIHPHTGLLLFSLVLNQRPQAIVETGTMFGYSTWFMAEALRLWGDPDSFVYTFDPDQRLVHESIRCHPNVRICPQRSEEGLPSLCDTLGEVQFAFLDSYKRQGLQEFMLLDEAIPPGGLLIFHDTQVFNTGHELYFHLGDDRLDYERVLLSGRPHHQHPHRYFGNCDDRGLMVLRKKEKDPFLEVADYDTTKFGSSQVSFSRVEEKP